MSLGCHVLLPEEGRTGSAVWPSRISQLTAAPCRVHVRVSLQSAALVPSTQLSPGVGLRDLAGLAPEERLSHLPWRAVAECVCLCKGRGTPQQGTVMLSASGVAPQHRTLTQSPADACAVACCGSPVRMWSPCVSCARFSHVSWCRFTSCPVVVAKDRGRAAVCSGPTWAPLPPCCAGPSLLMDHQSA